MLLCYSSTYFSIFFCRTIITHIPLNISTFHNLPDFCPCLALIFGLQRSQLDRTWHLHPGKKFRRFESDVAVRIFRGKEKKWGAVSWPQNVTSNLRIWWSLNWQLSDSSPMLTLLQLIRTLETFEDSTIELCIPNVRETKLRWPENLQGVPRCHAGLPHPMCRRSSATSCLPLVS